MSHRRAILTKLTVASLVIAAIAAYLKRSQKNDRAPQESTPSAISIDADSEQPLGMPIIMQVHVRNISSSPVRWWCGIGSSLPSAMNFKVETKHEHDSEWQTVRATNAEADEGSGIHLTLNPEESIVVPLAVPTRPQSIAGHVTKDPISVDSVHVRVRSSLDVTNSLAETKIRIAHDPKLVAERHLRMIHGITEPDTAFWNHVARTYADEAVLDAAFQLAMLKTQPVVTAACQVLAHQPTLPESRGAELSALVRYWEAEGDLDSPVIAAALATQSEIARQTALDVLFGTKSTISRSRALYALQMSPGNSEWLRRARSETVRLQKSLPSDESVQHRTRLVLHWIDGRLARVGK